MEVNTMEVRAVSDNSLRLLRNAAHVVLGISPFNSYFSEELIRDWVAWGRATFKEMHIFVPDVPTEYTLRAAGYSEAEAIRKARRQARYLLNKVGRALEAVDVPKDSADDLILTWDRLSSIPRYQELLEEATAAYRADAELQHDIRAEALCVLKGRAEPLARLSPENLDVAAQYFLCEMPLFVDTPTILRQESSVFAYRECGPMLEKLYGGRYHYRVSERQGFVVLGST